jgi:branched-chain amino acid aminotransferase
MSIVWRDGVFLSKSEFAISPLDRGLCHGLSLFETLLVVKGQPQLFDEHIERLLAGFDKLGIKANAQAYFGLHSAMVALIEKNALSDGRARLRLSVSFGEGALNDLSGKHSWAWMTAHALDAFPESVRVVTAPWKKAHQGMLCGLKTGNYAEPIIALDHARRMNCEEIIFFNTADELCEAAMANIFLIREGALMTPHLASGCLPGITRALLLRLAKADGIPCQEVSLSRDDLDQADCIFLTSSTKGLIWVSEVDGKSFHEHPLFHSLREKWLREMTL